MRTSAGTGPVLGWGKSEMRLPFASSTGDASDVTQADDSLYSRDVRQKTEQKRD